MRCELCGRETDLEKHHLIPKQKGGKKKQTILVCIPCGDQIHKLFTNKELKSKYNTLERLKSDERIQKWIVWIKKKDVNSVCMKCKKRK